MVKAQFFQLHENKWHEIGALTLKESSFPEAEGDLTWLDYSRKFYSPRLGKKIDMHQDPEEWLRLMSEAYAEHNHVQIKIVYDDGYHKPETHDWRPEGESAKAKITKARGPFWALIAFAPMISVFIVGIVLLLLAAFSALTMFALRKDLVPNLVPLTKVFQSGAMVSMLWVIAVVMMVVVLLKLFLWHVHKVRSRTSNQKLGYLSAVLAFVVIPLIVVVSVYGTNFDDKIKTAKHNHDLKHPPVSLVETEQ